MPGCESCSAVVPVGAEACPTCQTPVSGAAKLAAHAVGFFAAGYYAEAAALLAQACEAAPGDGALQIAWAHALFHQGRRDRAAKIYRSLPADSRPSPEVEFNLARCDLAAGRLDKARPVFERLSHEVPAFQSDVFYLGLFYRTPAEFQSDCLYHLALIHWNQGNPAFARLYLERAVALNPEHSAAHRHLGDLHYQAREYADAVGAYEKSLAVGSAAPEDEDRRVETRFRLAVSLGESGRADDAIAAFQRVLESRPGHPGAIRHLGRLYGERGIETEEDLHGAPAIEVSEGASTTFGLSTEPVVRTESQSGYAHSERRPIIGRSLVMQRVLRSARLAAASDSTVLITGENGTGKELIARAIHDNSPRRAGAFIAVSCAAIPENLLEDELFGHEKGAFTGATARRVGRLESAAGGTVFLDEVGDLSPAMQVKLLRFLQERTLTRVGGSDAIRVDTRIIAATNRDLDALIRSGRFRQDFHFRLNVIPLRLPPLRERTEDIPLLAAYFAAKHTARRGGPPHMLREEDIVLLKSHDWPGNVRELESVIERSLVLGLQIGSVLSARREASAPAPIPAAGESPSDTIARLISEGRIPDRRRRNSDWRPGPLEEIEKQHIIMTLRHTHGGRTEAARLLGINPATLWRKLKLYGIQTDPQPEQASAVHAKPQAGKRGRPRRTT